MAREYRLGDPIAALATPVGRGALCVIRVSGDGVVEKLTPLFSGAARLTESGKAIFGRFFALSGEEIDQVVVTPYRAPHGYTGEDAAEISAHGSPLVARRILQELFAAGFTLALPGEFTYRAYLNGKMDLTEAEAVQELIAAKSYVGVRRALTGLEGHLSGRLDPIYKRLLDIRGEITSHIDYPSEESDAPLDFNIAGELETLRSLIPNSNFSRVLERGALVVLAGKPNVGKSSLFNALLRSDRALVSSMAGTTRDYLDAELEINGLSVRLTDTAGLRESDDDTERLGIERSRTLLEEADLVLYIADALKPEFTKEGNAFPEKTLIVINKCDLASPERAGAVYVSAKTGAGVPELELIIASRIDVPGADAKAFEASLGSMRQRDLCERALSAAETFSLGSELLGLDELLLLISTASDALGELLGRNANREAIDNMFSRFCLGK